MREFEGAFVAHPLAVKHEPLATLEHASKVPAAEPARGGVATLVPEHRRERHAKASRRAQPPDDPGARLDLAWLERPEGRPSRAVFVTQGHEEERVLDGRQLLLCPRVGPLRAP